jgi:hypothetical protein
LIVDTPPENVGNDGLGYRFPPVYGHPPLFTSPTATTCGGVKPGTEATAMFDVYAEAPVGNPATVNVVLEFTADT